MRLMGLPQAFHAGAKRKRRKGRSDPIPCFYLT